MAIPYLACMALVARVYGLPPRVLPSIQAVEGGAADTVHLNKDGSEDYGVMQINTIWIPALARVAHMQAPAVRERLVTDPCFNIAAAGVILRSYLNEAGGDLMRAVGYYHSHTRALNEPYQVRVLSAATRLFVQATPDYVYPEPPAPRHPPREAPVRIQTASYRIVVHGPAVRRIGGHARVSRLSRH